MKNLLLLLLLTAVHFSFAQSTDSSSYYFQKGNVAKSDGRNLVALQLYKKSLQFNQENVDARRELGNVAFAMHQYPESIQAFNEVIKRIPEDRVATEKLTHLCFWTRKWNDAIGYGKKMVVQKSGLDANFIIGKSYYELEDYQQAFTFLQKAANEDPARAEIPYTIGRGFVEMSNYRAAAPFLSKAVQLDSSNSRWIYECALNYAAIPDDKTAIKYYALAAEKGYRTDNDYYENLSLSYEGLGQMDACLEILKKVLEKKPADLELLNSIADIHYRMGKYQEAIEYWDKILSFDKQNAKALYMIGMSYQKKGDKEKGKKLCDQAIKMDPSLEKLRQKKLKVGM